MTASVVNKNQLFESLPPVWPEPLLDAIRARIATSGQRLVILDDDPTGAQTSHGVPVLTAWTPQLLERELAQSNAFFVLTNSRALNGSDAVLRAEEVGRALREASRRTGVEIAVASRGDSTLRGHFPAEVDAFASAWAGEAGAAAQPSYLLVPYFAEGGRFTVGDVHYVQQGDSLIPAAETEFARDRVFGYVNSHLPSWVEEKTGGRLRASEVVIISIDDLRVGGPEVVAAKLKKAADGGAIIVNAADDRDIEVLVVGLLDAESAGKRFLYRTAASFVRIRAGISTRPLLTADELRGDGVAGGLVVVGSHIAKSSEQLNAALALPGINAIELRVDRLLADGGSETEVDSVSGEVSRLLAAGEDVVMYTSRVQRTGATESETLAIAGRVSGAVCVVLEKLAMRPRFLLIKGGNTASDVATRALGVRRAIALGQIQPGVPVWELGPEARFPGLCYVIYPGNVGEPNGVADAVRVLRS